MNALELIVKALKVFIGADPSKRHWVFAYVLVPLLTIVYIILVIAHFDFAPAFDDRVTVVPLRSEVQSDGTPRGRKGMIVLMDPEDLKITLPLGAAVDREIMTSVDPKTLSVNTDSFKSNGDRIWLNLPLAGVSDPVALMVMGDDFQEVLVPGRRVPISSLMLRPRGALGVLIASLIVDVLGFGLFLNVGFVASPGENEDGTGD